MPYKNKEVANEYRKQWERRNIEKVSEGNKIYRENNKDKQKEWRENNKEQQKEYREQNKDHIKKMRTEYNEINKEHQKAYRQEYAKCRSCKLFQTTYANNHLCSYCNPEKKKRLKTKELALKTFLEENNYTFVHNKKCNIDKSCQTYFPDFLIDCNTFFLVIECDENAHSSYPVDCEKTRENNICFNLGLPCVFLRFNPDKKGVKMNVKQQVLKSYIEYYKNKESLSIEYYENDEIIVDVVYLFY